MAEKRPNEILAEGKDYTYTSATEYIYNRFCVPGCGCLLVWK